MGFLTHILKLLGYYEDGTVCSEASAYKIQTSGNFPEESIRNSQKKIVFLHIRVLKFLAKVRMVSYNFV